jgi:hypothetical protein
MGKRRAGLSDGGDKKGFIQSGFMNRIDKTTYRININTPFQPPYANLAPKQTLDSLREYVPSLLIVFEAFC